MTRLSGPSSAHSRESGNPGRNVRAEQFALDPRFRGGERKKLAMDMIDYQTDPSRYRHWRIEYDGDVAYLVMDVDQAGGLGDYELKLNSYDLGVDIELNDAVQRLRFEHPEIRCVVIKSGKDNVFCAGANIRML